MTHAVWIEIPVKDLERALRFYEVVFELPPTKIFDGGGQRNGTLLHDPEGKRTGISLNQKPDFEPSDKGCYVYLDAGEDLTGHLNRVEPAGGKILAPKTSMGPAGYYATVMDTEGSVFALYSTR